MQLRANHLTLSRILLLPFPCMLLFGEMIEQLVALAVFSVLAATDWYDGKLARKHGPTVLGGLLDPMADKMFLAFTFLPMARIEGVTGSGVAAIPLWFVVAIFLRDLLVTSLRSLTATHKVEFHTATLAKFKTAIQMGGGGFLFWTVIWQDHRPVLIAGNAVAVAVVVIWSLVRLIRRQKVGLRMGTQVVGYCAALLVVIFAPVSYCLLAIGVTILAVTVISGLQYLVRVLRGMAQAGWPATFGEVSLSFVEVLSPIVLVSLFAFDFVPAWAPIALLTAELGIGGLDNLLATEKIHRRRWLAWLRCLGVLGLGVFGWLAAASWNDHGLTQVAVIAAASVSCLYAAGLFIAHRKVYIK